MNLPVGNNYIPYGTPIHMVTVLYRLLQEVFKIETENDDTFVWKYFQDDYEKSKISFDIGYNREGKVAGGRVSVILNRADTSNQILAVGKEAVFVDPKNSNQHQQAVLRSGINMYVRSKSSMEAEIVATYIYSVLIAFRSAMTRLLQVIQVDTLTMGTLQENIEDDKYFFIPLNLSYLTHSKWITLVDAPLLNSIVAGIIANDNKDNRGVLIN